MSLVMKHIHAFVVEMKFISLDDLKNREYD